MAWALYATWRALGPERGDPRLRHFGPGYPPPELPSRPESFLVACSIHSAERERDVLSVLESFSSAESK